MLVRVWIRVCQIPGPCVSVALDVNLQLKEG